MATKKPEHARAPHEAAHEHREAAPESLPQHGGSYHRQDDGSLKRVAGPALPPAPKHNVKE